MKSGEAFAAKIDGWRRDPAFSAIDAHPVFGEFGRAYYPAVFGDRRVDARFAVSEGETPLVIVLCASGEEHLDYYGMPIRLVRPPMGIDEPARRRAIAEAFAYIDALVSERKIRGVSISDDASLGRALSGRQTVPQST